MAVFIHVIRHAQADHNVSGSGIADPPLNPAGMKECESLRIDTGVLIADRIVASPMNRTIMTAIHGVTQDPNRKVKIELMPELQEISATPSCVGSPASELKKMYKDDDVDFEGLDEYWYIKDDNTPFAPDPAKVEQRAKLARQKLRKIGREEVARGNDNVHIAVVTHGEFVHWLTDDFIGFPVAGRNTGWSNCEARVYEITNLDAEDDEDVVMVEVPQSRERRLATDDGVDTPARRAEQAKEKETAKSYVMRHADIALMEQAKTAWWNHWNQPSDVDDAADDDDDE
ncbi:histidine phosphatase superfamily [Hypoxylon fragiforme]|uniref:histidine phosphatase superfamily n=1 Tax=Hypoxylon fragiforme TaxID=63214 RepID=UPI0020C6DC03|nr:histidine phosphatase superfamily [Hypoxylon fragiforme]KAI2611196.1 histidine phosphatase superfamily [Hypoxylon fragiforme]